MIRFRFENANQIFDGIEGEEIILPLAEAAAHRELAERYRLIVEIPAIVWEHGIERAKEQLTGFSDALCENIGAIAMCRELGITPHGGMFLNVTNSEAAAQYAALGCADITWSFELPFAKLRKTRSPIPAGAVCYGYLPLMKFRACPAMGEEGCKGCSRENYLTDRKGERFRIICRGSEYSELLNCVPLYVGDKSLPPLAFETLYFTVESREECRRIYEMYARRDEPDFRRTAGLYQRDLL